MSYDEDTIIENMDELMDAMRQERVIPIISNSFRIEQIFRNDEELVKRIKEAPQFFDEVRTIDQQLTKLWAEDINYPMSDDHNLARVVQFQQIATGKVERSRTQYIRFIIERLLKNGENEAAATVESLRRALKSAKPPTFSDVAAQLDYPRVPEGQEDSLRLLAKLPIKIYITTSFSNFLENALVAEGKTPTTQLCFCREAKEGTIINKAFRPNRDLGLDEEKYPLDTDHPAVVHLFGLEEYPNTLVLSEDDHIDFLMDAIEDMNSPEIYPSYLRGALQESSLFLLGYHLTDWDFRTLFRLISRIRKKDSEGPNIAIQFKPPLELRKQENALKYMQGYFAKTSFTVNWATANEFIREISKAWAVYAEGL